MNDLDLTEYERKRRAGTPEPPGNTEQQATGKPALFVVHKHSATRLHYDLRLELDGVLKSWAVPKGFALKLGRPHLAVMVEDHPFDYRQFEGVIPKGHYGAGPVIIWDRGEYLAKDARTRAESDEQMSRGLAAGKISFRLFGEKLAGEYALARTEGNNWLLFKKNAKGEENFDERSVESGKTLDELVREERVKDAGEAAASPPGEDYLPMFAQSASEPFDKPDWLFEPKWDGYRTLARLDRGRVELRSRRNLVFTQFAPVEQALTDWPHKLILDGEIVVIDESGRPNFNYLQAYQENPRGKLNYYLFDLLYLDGFDLRDVPLADRLELLDKLCALHLTPPLVRVRGQKDTGRRYWTEEILPNGYEGMVAKNLQSKYFSGRRSKEWLKIKRRKTQDAAIIGYSLGEGGRRIGSLYLAANRAGRLEYIGNVGSGLSAGIETDLLRRFRGWERLTPVVSVAAAAARRGAIWLEPELVCEVEYTEFTPEGLLRHPVFRGLRPDKTKEETEPDLVPATAEPVLLGETDRNSREIEAGGHAVTINNFRKLFWPEEKISKLDLAKYYLTIAPFILPHLKDRPQSLNRFPHGIGGESFFQKDTSDLNLPDWIETIPILSEEGETKQYLLCNNAATLAYLANLGSLELNPWLSKKGTLDRPDFAVIDLDPLEIPFLAVSEAAFCCHEVLTEFGASHYLKTSGATGLHIYIPLGARHSYLDARNFAEIICRLVHRRLPKTTSLERNPPKRRHKVYLDFLQNRRGATVAAVYSTRPVPGAAVSAPLAWNELRPDLDPAEFNLRNMAERIRERGDLFAGTLTEAVDLDSILGRIGEKYG